MPHFPELSLTSLTIHLYEQIIIRQMKKWRNVEQAIHLLLPVWAKQISQSEVAQNEHIFVIGAAGSVLYKRGSRN